MKINDFKIKNYKPSNVHEYYKIEKENLAARRSTKHTKDKPIVELKAVPAKDGRLYNFVRETLPSNALEYIRSKGCTASQPRSSSKINNKFTHLIF